MYNAVPTSDSFLISGTGRDPISEHNSPRNRLPLLQDQSRSRLLDRPVLPVAGLGDGTKLRHLERQQRRQAENHGSER